MTGQSVSQYKIREKPGKGGMGVIYYDERLSQSSVLKVYLILIAHR